MWMIAQVINRSREKPEFNLIQSLYSNAEEESFQSKVAAEFTSDTFNVSFVSTPAQNNQQHNLMFTNPAFQLFTIYWITWILSRH